MTETFFTLWPYRVREDTERRKITVAEICRQVCEKRNLTLEELRGPCRMRDVTMARAEFGWRARRETNASFPRIGRYLRKDHTSAINWTRRWPELEALERERAVEKPVLQVLRSGAIGVD